MTMDDKCQLLSDNCQKVCGAETKIQKSEKLKSQKIPFFKKKTHDTSPKTQVKQRLTINSLERLSQTFPQII